MSSIWKNLLWKEWREHRWKLLALSALTLVIPALFSISKPGDIFTNVASTLLLIVPLGSLFVGMGAAASEQSHGTLPFLQALPAPASRLAVVRLLMAALTVSVPVVAGVAAGMIWKQLFLGSQYLENESMPRDVAGQVWMIDNWRLGLVAAGILSGVSLLVWMAALGVNRRDEVRAGAVGLLAIAALWTVTSFILFKTTTNPTAQNPTWFRVVSAALPGGAGQVRPPKSDPAAGWLAAGWPYALAALASNGFAAAWFVVRFGRVSTALRQEVDRRPRAVKPAWLAPPRRSPLSAILWKQMRETLPLAAMGAAVIFAVTLIGMEVIRQSPDPRAQVGFPGDALRLATALWATIGGFVAIVAGLGVFMDDLRPGLHGFWRSRPISVDQWFLAKVTAGGLTTIAMLAVPPLAIAGYTAIAYGSEITLGQYAEPFATGVFCQLGVFCAAVSAIVLLRQPIYAAFLALTATLSTILLADWMQVRTYHTLLCTVALAAAGSLAAIAIAWIAVRKDWGWRG